MPSQQFEGRPGTAEAVGQSGRWEVLAELVGAIEAESLLRELNFRLRLRHSALPSQRDPGSHNFVGASIGMPLP